ncbi:MAG: hypothetical protein EHM20_16605 [Alphaproteobacteria bacterium]|nr:MAG: hypothetical protein EHM20_16605 [Alphaproteobacteria bacterium]
MIDFFKKKMFILVAICISLLGINIIFWLFFNERVRDTYLNLIDLKSYIIAFEKLEGKKPKSFIELRKFLGPNMPLHKEYLSTLMGNNAEHYTKDGKGGWYYDPNDGNVAVNLLKPVRFYAPFYFGSLRDTIPAEWSVTEINE